MTPASKPGQPAARTPHPATAASTPAPPATSDLLHDVQRYLAQYVSFPSLDYGFVAALYAAATYLWPSFDAFPYLVITSDTKRSGKSRFAELLSFVSSNSRNFAGTTPATLFRSIRDENPTLFIDEAETLSSEAASTMRAVLNVGYRKGQTIPRMGKHGVEQWPAYCPKVFILIGDVYDTLRDRSIIIRMVRGTPAERFVYEHARGDGAALGERLAAAVADAKLTILDKYTSHAGLHFLPDRDEEIWMPLFAVCLALAPERLELLERIAVDMATEKTADVRRYSELAGADDKAEEHEYGLRLLADLARVIGTAKHITTAEAITRLHAVPTGPWRKFRGAGLTVQDAARLLSPLGIKPRNVRTAGGRAGSAVLRGYSGDDVRAAVQRHAAALPK